MKKHIKNRTYNTEAAQKVWSWDNGRPEVDPAWARETLFRKVKDGELFLYGEGGSESRYARRGGRGVWLPGADIDPMGLGEAEDWAVSRGCPGDVLARYFPDRGEPPAGGDEKVSVTIKCTSAVRDALRREAAVHGEALGQTLARLLGVGGEG